MFDHQFPFDPTYGYTESTLRAIEPPPVPEGFEAFWRDTYTQARAVDPHPTIRPITSPEPALELFEVEYTGLDGFRVGGWLTRPVGQIPVRGLIFGHGYGGRDAAEFHIPGSPAVALFPCARGFHRSARPDLPANSPAHVTHGLENRNTYINRFCVADLWSAVSALTEIAPEIAHHIDYMGTSFGGGLGSLALPWEPRFKRAFLGVPTFGHHPIRVTIPCVGSGESVRQLFLTNPQIAQPLSYFDAAIAARFCHVPTLVSCALFDPAVPPPGQFAIYNSLAGHRELFVRKSDHFAWEGTPAEDRSLFRVQTRWFNQAPALAACSMKK